MIVILNNGTRLKISRELGQGVLQTLLKDSRACNAWQIGSDITDNKIRGFAMPHVSAICEQEDVVDLDATLTLLEEFRDSLRLDALELSAYDYWHERFRQFVLLSQKK